MSEMDTSSLMSGEGKQSAACRSRPSALPRLYGSHENQIRDSLYCGPSVSLISRAEFPSTSREIGIWLQPSREDLVGNRIPFAVSSEEFRQEGVPHRHLLQRWMASRVALRPEGFRCLDGRHRRLLAFVILRDGWLSSNDRVDWV
jgi:hypothetical protein